MCMKLMNDSLQKLIMENSYDIRFNERQDQEAMAHIKVDGWRDCYQGIIENHYLQFLDYEEQYNCYMESFEEYKNSVFVAVSKENQEVLGYACFNECLKDEIDDSELVSLYIKPSEKGKGIGTRLLKETLHYLKSKGCHSTILWCFVDNKQALSFYKKTGGTIVSEKFAKIGDHEYKEYGIRYSLDAM